MELRHLRLVSTVARLGTLSKSSEKLFLTQSALSHQLKELESELGTVVFHRVNKKLVLSETGEVLLHYADTILSSLNDLEEKINEMKGQKLGNIRIAVEAYTSYFWLPPLLKEFHKTYPNIEISINTENLTRPLRLIKDRKLDFGLVIFKDNDPNISYENLIDDELVLVVNTDHKFADQDYIEIDELQGEKLFTHSKKNERAKVLESTYGNIALKSVKYVHVGQTQTILEMVKEGLGLAVLSRWAITPYLDGDRLRIIRLGKHGSHRNWHLAYLRNKEMKNYEMRFIGLLKSKLKRIDQSNPDG